MAVTFGPQRPRHSAKILAFPLRERVSPRASREQKFAMMEATARRMASDAASSDGWYHEAALAEERDRKH